MQDKDTVWDSFTSGETYLKIAFLLVTMPIWGPVLKTILHELKLAATTPRGSLTDRKPPPPVPRPPGEDPWVSVPLARHRRSRSR